MLATRRGVVHRQVAVDAHPQLARRVERSQLAHPLLVDEQLGDRRPPTRQRGVDRLRRFVEAHHGAVPDPVRVGVDEARVEHVVAEVDHPRVGAGRGHDRGKVSGGKHLTVADGDRLDLGRLAQRDDPPDEHRRRARPCRLVVDRRGAGGVRDRGAGDDRRGAGRPRGSLTRMAVRVTRFGWSRAISSMSARSSPRCPGTRWRRSPHGCRRRRGSAVGDADSGLAAQ